MPTTAIQRPGSEAPPLGALYRFADDHPFADGDQHFEGVVTNVAEVDAKYVAITLALTADEHKRLLASRR